MKSRSVIILLFSGTEKHWNDETLQAPTHPVSFAQGPWIDVSHHSFGTLRSHDVGFLPCKRSAFSLAATCILTRLGKRFRPFRVPGDFATRNKAGSCCHECILEGEHHLPQRVLDIFALSHRYRYCFWKTIGSASKRERADFPLHCYSSSHWAAESAVLCDRVSYL